MAPKQHYNSEVATGQLESALKAVASGGTTKNDESGDGMAIHDKRRSHE